MQNNVTKQHYRSEFVRFLSRPPINIFQSLSQFTDHAVVLIDYDNLAQYLYSLYDGKYVYMHGLLDIAMDRQMIMLDVPQLASLLISDIVDYIYYLRVKVKNETGLNLFPVFFSAVGISRYHVRYDEQYKANRRLSFYKLDDPVLTYNIRLVHGAKRLAVKLMNELLLLVPNTTSIVLDRWEADFLPKVIERFAPNSVILTLSNDSDMLQLVSDRHFVWRRLHMKKERRDVLVTNKNVHLHMFKGVNSNYAEHIQKSVPFYTLCKAIMGDPGDNVIGIKGYGPVRTVKLVSYLVDKHDLTPDVVKSDDGLRKMLRNVFNEKEVEQIIVNFKLVDYDRIADEFEKETNEVEYIHERLRNITEGANLVDALNTFDLLPSFVAKYQLYQVYKC